MRRRHLAALCALALGLAAARAAAEGVGDRGAGAAAAPRVEVAAAASLAEVLPRIAAARGLTDRTRFRFDASSRLAKQIEQGMPAAVFVSADLEWVDYLERAGRVVPGSRVEVTGNRLVVVVPRGRAAGLAGPADLARVDRLALAGEAVPAGRYARAALAATGAWPAVEKKVVSGDSVRTALAWVARGEAAAGVVYASDARAEPRVEVAFAFPPASHPRIVYVAAAIAGERGAAPTHPEAAAAFLGALRSPEARALLEEAGFTPLAAPAK